MDANYHISHLIGSNTYSSRHTLDFKLWLYIFKTLQRFILRIFVFHDTTMQKQKNTLQHDIIVLRLDN